MKVLEKNKMKPTPLGDWKFNGFLGERIDVFAKNRLMSEYAWSEIYPETEEAFRLREDDRSHPGRGVWRGEFWGKYILSVIAACRYYSSEDLKKRISDAVKGLLSTQDDNGYIGTYSDSKYFGRNTWNIWGRKYTLWGLIEAWELLGEDAILKAAQRFADHIISEVGTKEHSIINTGQFGGLPSTSILKPVVILYRATGNAKYLDFAEFIVEQWANNEDGFPDIVNKGLEGTPIHTWFPNPYSWAKGYEFVSCVEGILELYKITEKTSYLTAAKNIYDGILEWERSPVGSVGFNDKFIGSKRLINTVSEICDAVYWNRLSFELFQLTGNMVYIDEIERTLYNALLCGMKPDGTWGLRRLRLSHEHIPAHKHFLKNHQCCVDNLPRGLFQAAQSAVFTNEEGVYITLYNAGEGKLDLPSGNKAGCSIKGDFMDEGIYEIQFALEKPETFTLHLRIPYWSKGATITINGKDVLEGTPGEWASIQREWATGDIAKVVFEIEVRTETFDPGLLSADDPLVLWHEKEWASMGFIMEDQVKMSVQKNSGLSIEDALPHKKAVMFFRGPVALARDVRLGDSDIFKPVSVDMESDNKPVLTPSKAPEGIWKAYELKFASGEKVKLCDFASAGNTWDSKSSFVGYFVPPEIRR